MRRGEIKKIKGAHGRPGRQRRMWSMGKMMLKQHTCAARIERIQKVGRNCCKEKEDPERDGRGDLFGGSRNTCLCGKGEDTYNMNMDACGCTDCV